MVRIEVIGDSSACATSFLNEVKQIVGLTVGDLAASLSRHYYGKQPDFKLTFYQTLDPNDSDFPHKLVFDSNRDTFYLEEELVFKDPSQLPPHLRESRVETIADPLRSKVLLAFKDLPIDSLCSLPSRFD